MRAVPLSWSTATLADIGMPSTSKIDPAAFPEEIFELYSVPSFARGAPDRVKGSAIGSTKQIVGPGDVLLCKIIPHLNRVWVAQDPQGYRQIASSEWIVIRSAACNAASLQYCLSEPTFRAEFLKELSRF